MPNDLTALQNVILNTIRESGLTEFTAAFKSISFVQLRIADPRIKATEDSVGFDPSDIWSATVDNLYRLAKLSTDTRSH